MIAFSSTVGNASPGSHGATLPSSTSAEKTKSASRRRQTTGPW
jgi:hypothetical protein